MIFVDTGAWYSSVVPDSEHHAPAASFLQHNTQVLVTTDYVVDETLTLLKARGHAALAQLVAQRFFAGQLARVHYLTRAEIGAAYNAFRQFADKDWSFTDCTSKVFIERVRIRTAFAFDHHFRQFGTLTVLP